MLVVLALGAALALVTAAPAQKPKPTGSKKTAKKASTSNAAKSKGSTPAKKTTGKKATGTKKSTSGKASGKQASSKQTAARYRRSTQREPAPERYQEIQQSLANKGYFAGPVNGSWGPDSVAALKRFQRDQNIGDDGKLGSLSLMALGLGPKRAASGAAEKPESPEAGPPPP